MDAASPKSSKSGILKFFVCSAIGIFLFFVPLYCGGSGKVPMVHLMNAFQSFLGFEFQKVFVMFSCVGVLLCSLICRFGSRVPGLLKQTYRKDGLFSRFTYVTAVIFSLMVIFNMGPKAILDPRVGLMSVEIAADSFAAIMVAGTLVAFITEFGFLEFLGKLLEPLMRRLYRIPGKSAVDALSSFVIAPAAGVMITNDLYHKGVYTDKEACSITTNFSIASLGGFAFLSSIAGVSDLYVEVVLAAFIATFLMAAIMVRIPPISMKANTYFDGRLQSEAERVPPHYDSNTLRDALKDGIEKASGSRLSVFWEQLKSSFMFGVKVNAFIVSLSVICLLVSKHTPITEWIAIPMAPVLRLLGLAEAEIIAAPSVVGILALSLPATLIKGTMIPAASAFFVVVLSTSQIIFFTESANAMLESDIPLSFWDLIGIFLIRTVFLVPIVALLTRIMV